MADGISLEEFGEALSDLLGKEAMNAEESLDEIIEKRTKQIRDRLRQRSPKDTGGYAKGWRVKTVTRNHEKVKVIYNAEKPWLTFVLEYGNQHQPAQPHIRKIVLEAADEIIEELVDRL
ncbi:hypothetical protein CE91St43_05590 [Oscillospiraceae bacterium]|nr:hypothetical protein CE91St43_05590 [Oscillospiraceae bacterium]